MAENFESFGYRNGRAMATLAGVTELTAGAGLVTGTTVWRLLRDEQK
nr:hypothetical protein [Streptomyces sp. ISID311]